MFLGPLTSWCREAKNQCFRMPPRYFFGCFKLGLKGPSTLKLLPVKDQAEIDFYPLCTWGNRRQWLRLKEAERKERKNNLPGTHLGRAPEEGFDVV